MNWLKLNTCDPGQMDLMVELMLALNNEAFV